MQPGETITITITGNIKSGKTTISRLIANTLRHVGLPVGVDHPGDHTNQHAVYDADILAKLIEAGTRIEVEESIPSMHTDERKPLEARIMLRPDGTYTIMRKA